MVMPVSFRPLRKRKAPSFPPLTSNEQSVEPARICLRMTQSTAEAEDLTQEVFLQLFRKIGTFRSESPFSTWLHRMSVNMVLAQLRKKGLPLVALDEAAEGKEEGTETVPDVAAQPLIAVNKLVAAQKDLRCATLDRATFKQVVVNVHMVCLGADRLSMFRIPHHNICVSTN